jgi:hypothetical protein
MGLPSYQARAWRTPSNSNRLKVMPDESRIVQPTANSTQKKAAPGPVTCQIVMGIGCQKNSMMKPTSEAAIV